MPQQISNAQLASELTDHILEACSGVPTAVVYTAIANVLGFMETLNDSPLARLTKGAQLEKSLRRLKPGECYDVRREDWLDIEVPTNPLDRQTPAFLVEWFRSRMPFYCETHEDILTGKWTFCRPTEERMRELARRNSTSG